MYIYACICVHTHTPTYTHTHIHSMFLCQFESLKNRNQPGLNIELKKKKIGYNSHEEKRGKERRIHIKSLEL